MDGFSSLVENRQVIGVFEIFRVERYVEVVTLPGVDADVVKVRLPKVRPILSKVIAMNGRVEDPRILVKLVLRSLAVVHVKVDNEHLGHIQVGERVPRRDGHVVAEAEAAEIIFGGMVAGRPHEPKAIANLPLAHGRDLWVECAVS